MALIKCPECGESISDKATVCIRCGYPLKELGAPQSSAEKDTSEERKAKDDPEIAGESTDGNPIEQESIHLFDQSDDIGEECIIDVPKEKYIKWLLIISVAATLIYNVVTMISREYFHWIYLVRPLLVFLPGAALIYNAKRETKKARLYSVVFAVICCASVVYELVSYGGFRLTSIVPVLPCVYLVVYIFQSEEKQENALWFVLGCIIVPLYTVLSIIFGWEGTSNMVNLAFSRIVTILGWTYYLVGYAPRRWYQKYTLKEMTKKRVLQGRIAAFVCGVVAVVVQIIGSIGVSSKEYQDALWSYQLSSYDYSKQRELLKILQPLSDKYYRDNTISIIIACIALAIFIITLVVVHKKKHICEE